MKQLRKRFLAIIVCLTMIVSLLPQGVVYATETTDTAQEYQIYPTPHEVTYQDGDYIIRSEVNVVYESTIDEVTKNRMSEVLGSKNKTVTVSDAVQAGKTNVLVGTYGSGEYVDTYAAENYTIDEALFDKYASHYVISSNDEIIILGLDTDAAFYGITSLKHIFNQMEGSTIRNFTIKDYADVNIRGFIEGYYGLPWSNEDRMSLMEFGGDFKMTSYVFAPKDDEYHTSKWRDEYPTEELAEIAEMVALGNSVKCRFVWTAHPFMGGFDSTDVDGEIDALLAKFEQLYSVGVRQFGVLGDDVGSLDKDIVIQVMTAVSEWANEKGDVYDSVFCPAGYNHSWQGDYTELNTYDAGFPDDVQIFWTGEAVCQPVEQTTLDHFRTYNYTATDEKAERRAPLFWLNWPVNDINHSRMLMGKGSLLQTDINVEDLAGLVTNPMQEAQASKVAIFAVADYSWNVAAFDDDQSWADSFAYIEADATEELHTLAKHMSNPEPNGHGLVLAESEELQPLIDEFESKLAAGESLAETGAQLVAEMDVIIDACDGFHANSKNTNLKEELLPFTNSLKDLATAIKNYTLAAIALEEGNGTEAFEYYAVALEAHENSESHQKVARDGIEYVDPGSTHLIPLAETIQEAIADEVTTYALGGEVAVKITASSSFSSFYNGSIENIVDGDNSTHAWYGGYEAVGQYYQVNLSEPSTVYGVDILNGSASSGKGQDTFQSAKLQYTTDGSTWVDVPNGATTTEYPETFAVNGLELENVVAVRYICTVAGSKWPSMREFTVKLTEEAAEAPEFTSEVIRTTDGWSYYANDDSYLIDGDTSSYVWYNVRQGADSNADTSIAGDYIGVKLSQAITLGQITVLQGKTSSDGDYFTNATLQYSEDGENWTDIETYDEVHDISIDLSSQEITAQYVRLLNNENTGWVAFREFTVEAKQNYNGNAYTNVEAYVDAEANYGVDAHELVALSGVTLENGEYIGLKLDRIHELQAIDVTTTSTALTLEISENSVEWTTVEAGEISADARYIRLINNTGSAVTFDITEFTVSTVEVEDKSIEATNYSTFNGDFSLLFDGDWTTSSQFAASQTEGMYVTIDLGSEITLNSFKAVCTDSEWDYPRHAKFSVSADGSSWTEIMTLGSQTGANEGEADNTDDINDVLTVHDVSYNTESVSGLNIAARYLKFEITRTKEGADKWVRFQEFEINGGEYIPTENDPTVEGPAEDRGNLYSYMTDASLSTMYTWNGEVVYHESEEEAVNTVKIIQSGISNAAVSARLAGDELYTIIGTLSQTINEFTVDGEILDVMITTADDAQASVTEMMFSSKSAASVDKTVLAQLLNTAEDTASWTAETAEIYETALAAAQEINDSEYAAQSTVDSIVQQLQKAIDTKELKGEADAVRAELAVEVLDEVSYTTATWKEYAKAVNAANQALADADNMSEADAAALIAELQAAREALRYNPTKYEEASLYADECAETEVDETLYTAESYEAYTTAVATLEEMVAEGSQAYTPAEFETAKNTAEEKMDALVLAGEEEIDKTALAAAIGTAEGLTEADYTAETWAALATELAEAKAVNENENATQEEVNTALSELQAAMDALEDAAEETPTQEVCEIYTDVAHGAWYEESVQYVYENNIMTGSEGLFLPDGAVTRAMVAETLYKMEGRPEVTDYTEYDQLTDLSRDNWWAASVAWALNTDVATGDTYNMVFNPEDSVTREQLATFLYRYANNKGLNTTQAGDLSGMLNSDQVNSFAQEAITWAVGAGLISGIQSTDANGNAIYDLAPQAGATRAELAAVLMRFCEAYNL